MRSTKISMSSIMDVPGIIGGMFAVQYVPVTLLCYPLWMFAGIIGGMFVVQYVRVTLLRYPL